MSKKPEDLQGVDYYLWLAEYFKFQRQFRSEGTTAARGKRSAARDAHIARPLELRAEGKSVAQIAMRMADEDGKPEPYAKRTINRWLGAAVPKKG